jgi:hypothetical protein
MSKKRTRTPAADRTFNRIPHLDPRNKSYGLRQTLITIGAAQKPRRSFTWSVGVSLDQGQEGACVGFGWAAECAARPVAIPAVTNQLAFGFYAASQQIDREEGRVYDSGATVLAGAKALCRAGYLREYRWPTGPGPGGAENDLALAVGYKGPAVLGTVWTEGMDEPDEDGYLRPVGEERGGHCYLVPIYSVKKDGYGIWNSWGTGFYGWIHRTDMVTLLDRDGEACVPVIRAKPALAQTALETFLPPRKKMTRRL